MLIPQVTGRMCSAVIAFCALNGWVQAQKRYDVGATDAEIELRDIVAIQRFAICIWRDRYVKGASDPKLEDDAGTSSASTSS